MKKLKCESCGGDIELDENKEFATCPFCQTKYQLNETKNIYIKMYASLFFHFISSFHISFGLVSPSQYPVHEIPFCNFSSCAVGYRFFEQ